MNLAAMAPHEALASTGFCLAEPGKEYLVYLPAGGEVTVDLSPSAEPFQVEWMHAVEGTITHGEATTGGARRVFTAPFAGDAVLYLSR
jgi:Putative collagen-binding domain of a collagenase